MPRVSSALAALLLLFAPQAAGRKLTAFAWNVHWECGSADHECRERAMRKFGELVKSEGAEIAVAIELTGASRGLPGWNTSGEYNQVGRHKDAVSVTVPSTWKVHNRGGGHIESGHGDRGIAVMLVTPPFQVTGCPKLCVIGLHPGHSPITGGKDIVEGVCGHTVARTCTIAAGDWNASAESVKGGSFDSWRKLIGGTARVVAPNELTCCHPSTGHRFDHAGTNIMGATLHSSKVFPYQMRTPTEHKPISVTFNLPTSGSSPSPVPSPVPAPEPSPSSSSCSTLNWFDVKRTCGGCKVLANNMSAKYRTCKAYCERQGRSCVGAWEENDNTCSVQSTKTCTFDFDFTSDAICECSSNNSKSSSPSPSPPALGPCSTANWSDVKRSCGTCKVLAKNMSSRHRTCKKYCESQGRQCVNAWDERFDSCWASGSKGCNFDFHFTSDAICQCS